MLFVAAVRALRSSVLQTQPGQLHYSIYYTQLLLGANHLLLPNDTVKFCPAFLRISIYQLAYTSDAVERNRGDESRLTICGLIYCASFRGDIQIFIIKIGMSGVLRWAPSMDKRSLLTLLATRLQAVDDGYLTPRGLFTNSRTHSRVVQPWTNFDGVFEPVHVRRRLVHSAAVVEDALGM